MQPFGWGEVVHVGGCNPHPMDQERVFALASLVLHAEVPLVTFLGLVHLRIPLPRFVLGGAGVDNHNIIRDLVADQLDACKAGHGGHLNQDLLHRWVDE